MDSLGWLGSPFVTNTLSYWSNQEHDTAETSMASNSTNFCVNNGGNVEFPGDIFLPIQQLQKTLSSHINSDFGMLNQLQKTDGFHKGKGSISTTTGRSLGSGDCLVSATNSNTGTSVEDDGFSFIFSSDCKNLWKYDHGQANTRPNTTKRSSDHIQAKASGNCCYFDFCQSDSSTTEGSKLVSEILPKPKKPRPDIKPPSSSNINFQQPCSSVSSVEELPGDSETIAHMKEMIYRAAAFRPVNFGMEVVKEKPKRKNVRISNDPQTVVARQRRERISERIRVLQRIVPGGSKLDTASMLDEAANYLKFLRSQVKALESLGRSHKLDLINSTTHFPMQANNFLLQSPNSIIHHHNSWKSCFLQ